MQVRKRKKNIQKKKEKKSIYMVLRQHKVCVEPLPPRESDVAVDGAPLEQPEGQNKGNIFSTDGNRPY